MKLNQSEEQLFILLQNKSFTQTLPPDRVLNHVSVRGGLSTTGHQTLKIAADPHHYHTSLWLTATMWHITGEQLIALLLIPLKSHQPPSWGSELMLSAAILGRPVITFNMENQQKAFDVFSEKWLKNQQVQFVCVWRLMSVSCCMSITLTQNLETLTCVHKDAWKPNEGLSSGSRNLFIQEM